jgi:sulfur-oxidizing protein SoxX
MAAGIGAALGWAVPARSQDAPLHSDAIVDDAVPASLTGSAGDAGRGRAIVASRQVGLCLLCHTGPFPEERFQGTLGPDLRGVGARWSTAQLRLRLIDSSRLNPDTIMPSYYRIDHLARVGRAWQGKPVLTAQEIEDVVSFLATLRD